MSKPFTNRSNRRHQYMFPVRGSQKPLKIKSCIKELVLGHIQIVINRPSVSSFVTCLCLY